MTRWISGCCILILVCIVWTAAEAQDKPQDWKRAVTGAGSVIDVDASSLQFEPGHVLIARFRTVLLKAEALPDDPRSKYRSTLETIPFNYARLEYRVVEMQLLDKNQKILQTMVAEPAKPWKPKRGPTADQLFNVLETLRPFGRWRVDSYRFVDGSPATGNEPGSLTKFVGTRVIMLIDRMIVGNETCHAPAYESTTISKTELSKQLLGADIDALGITSDPVDTIRITCESGGWKIRQSLLIPRPKGRMLMLWYGVFLDLSIDDPRSFSIPIIVK